MRQKFDNIDGFCLFTFLGNVRVRQYLSGKKLEIESTIKTERNETWPVL